MTCPTARERLADLLLAPADRPGDDDLRAHLLTCADCRAEFASLRLTLDALDAAAAPPPSPRLRLAVHAAIDEAKRSLRSPASGAAGRRAAASLRPGSPALWLRGLVPLAACALVALGFMLGRHSGAPTGPAPAPDPATERELARLNARLDAVSQTVESALLPEHPASERLQRVLARASTAKPAAGATAELLEALALDPSVSVRLSALDALYARADQPTVRAGVIACLAREPSPLIQVAMIDFLVGARDRAAEPEFRRLVADTKADLDVRESARRALDQL
jgi:hypothetical protein